MIKPYLVTGGLIVTLATLGVVAHQSRTAVAPQATAAQTTPDKTDKPVIDPAATGALDRMGTYLRSLKAFQVQTTGTADDVLEDGQTVTFSAVTDLLVAPNRVRAVVTSDRKARVFLYDGKSFTLFAPRMNYYATVPAPATTQELVDMLDDKYNIELPLVDLFRWGGPNARRTIADMTAAGDFGPSAVAGTTCQHYAFRQEGLDWQIWIQNGDFPLPRKLVLTTLTDEARPQYTVEYTWQLAPSFSDDAFTFIPPPDAQKIVFAGK